MTSVARRRSARTAAGRRGRQISVVVAVHADLVAGRDDLRRQRRRPVDHRAEQEKGGPDLPLGERRQEQRRRVRIRPVVEGERDVAGVTLAGQPGEQQLADRTQAGDTRSGLRDCDRAEPAQGRHDGGLRPHAGQALRHISHSAGRNVAMTRDPVMAAGPDTHVKVPTCRANTRDHVLEAFCRPGGQGETPRLAAGLSSGDAPKIVQSRGTRIVSASSAHCISGR